MYLLQCFVNQTHSKANCCIFRGFNLRINRTTPNAGLSASHLKQVSRRANVCMTIKGAWRSVYKQVRRLLSWTQWKVFKHRYELASLKTKARNKVVRSKLNSICINTEFVNLVKIILLKLCAASNHTNRDAEFERPGMTI